MILRVPRQAVGVESRPGSSQGQEHQNPRASGTRNGDDCGMVDGIGEYHIINIYIYIHIHIYIYIYTHTNIYSIIYTHINIYIYIFKYIKVNVNDLTVLRYWNHG